MQKHASIVSTQIVRLRTHKLTHTVYLCYESPLGALGRSLSCVGCMSQDRLNLCSLDLSHSLHASMGRVDSHEPRRGGSAPRPSHSVSHTGPPHTHVTLSRSPPASLVSGLAAMEQGLRHRHPSKLVTVTQQGNTGSESSRDKDSSAHAEPVLPSQPVLGVAAPTAQEGLAPASGGSGAALAVPLFCRLLRSALGRLTCLTGTSKQCKPRSSWHEA